MDSEALALIINPGFSSGLALRKGKEVGPILRSVSAGVGPLLSGACAGFSTDPRLQARRGRVSGDSIPL